MSEDSGARPAPIVLDASVLVAVARGDADVMSLVQGYDADGVPLVVPVLGVAGALLDTGTADAERVFRGLERMPNAMPAPLSGAGQAARLAAVIAMTGLDPWDAHVAAVADAGVCPILTLAPAKWRDHAHDLAEPLHFIEIADPEE